MPITAIILDEHTASTLEASKDGSFQQKFIVEKVMGPELTKLQPQLTWGKHDGHRWLKVRARAALEVVA